MPSIYILTCVTSHILFYWITTPCDLAGGYTRFGKYILLPALRVPWSSSKHVPRTCHLPERTVSSLNNCTVNCHHCGTLKPHMGSLYRLPWLIAAEKLWHSLTTIDSLRAGQSGDRIPAGARFSAPVQTGPGAHPASYAMGTGSRSRGLSGWRGGVALTTHPHLVQLPLWAFMAKRGSWGWTLPFFLNLHTTHTFSGRVAKNIHGTTFTRKSLGTNNRQPTFSFNSVLPSLGSQTRSLYSAVKCQDQERYY